MHATPNSANVTTVAVDIANDVFELAFADADARIFGLKGTEVIDLASHHAATSIMPSSRL
ncbi:MAG: hypothetical protein EOP90_05485 [Lysobacteraceae bacterium]|nr:MAG: hypothetical protein EOP90_05485 [Xanthomonadaceae bacterium]